MAYDGQVIALNEKRRTEAGNRSGGPTRKETRRYSWALDMKRFGMNWRPIHRGSGARSMEVGLMIHGEKTRLKRAAQYCYADYSAAYGGVIAAVTGIAAATAVPVTLPDRARGHAEGRYISSPRNSTLSTFTAVF